jgi:hypothetical protein
MRSSSIIVLAAGIWFALAAAASAAEEAGYQAKFRITMTFSNEFYKTIEADSQTGSDSGWGEIDLEPVTGNLYYTGKLLRMDMSVGPAGLSVSSIVDRPANIMYMVDHSTTTAWSLDLAAYEQQYAQSGLPLLNPEQVFAHWDEVYEILKATPGIKAKDLGSKTIDGRKCHGLSFSCRIEDVLKADAVSLLPQLQPLHNMQGKWSGEFWLDEKIGLPLLLTEDMLGAQFRWELSELTEAPLSSALFKIPRGYKVRPMEPDDLSSLGA